MTAPDLPDATRLPGEQPYNRRYPYHRLVDIEVSTTEPERVAFYRCACGLRGAASRAYDGDNVAAKAALNHRAHVRRLEIAGAAGPRSDVPADNAKRPGNHHLPAWHPGRDVGGPTDPDGPLRIGTSGSSRAPTPCVMPRADEARVHAWLREARALGDHPPVTWTLGVERRGLRARLGMRLVRAGAWLVRTVNPGATVSIDEAPPLWTHKPRTLPDPGRPPERINP